MAASLEQLHSDFDHLLGAEVVDSTHTSTLELLRDPSRAVDFTLLRLQAMAESGGLSPHLPTVLFLCIHNSGRSQMALGYFRHLAGDQAIGWSGGSAPGLAINPAAVTAMAEVGIDISAEYPKPWTPELLTATDVVVTMGCGDECPYVPGTRYEDWPLEDPAGQGVEAVRPIRDEIAVKVQRLLDELLSDQ